MTPNPSHRRLNWLSEKHHKRSNLRETFIPSSPIPLSPRIPKKSSMSTLKPTLNDESLPKPPQTPGPMYWICHKCKQSWPLAASRRCLDCNHFVCYLPAKKACDVRFDYVSWRNYNAWRRQISTSLTDGQEDEKKIKEFKDCWTDCDWPGECRHAAYYDVDTPLTTPCDSPIDPSCTDEELPTSEKTIDPLDTAEE